MKKCTSISPSVTPRGDSALRFHVNVLDVPVLNDWKDIHHWDVLLSWT